MTPSPARRPTGTSTRSSSSPIARYSRASCRPATASTARSGSAAPVARRSAAPGATRANGNPRRPSPPPPDPAKRGARDGVIEIEPMGNMPVLKDLIVDMDAVHWKKIQRVTPWLLAKQPVPEREYLVPRESMVDVTQTMACIQCGACVSDCLAMEVDPGFIGPAALAKSYRFVGDPRDDQQYERLNDLAQDPQGIFDCTHCFKCVEACPKDVNPMGQIMREVV